LQQTVILAVGQRQIAQHLTRFGKWIDSQFVQYLCPEIIADSIEYLLEEQNLADGLVPVLGIWRDGFRNILAKRAIVKDWIWTYKEAKIEQQALGTTRTGKGTSVDSPIVG
jgi:hypothetical protein